MRMRRHIIRFLRLRNLLLLTIILIFFFVIKSLSSLEPNPEATWLKNYPDYNPLSLGLDNKIEHFVPASLKKIDWHNHKQIESDKKLIGLGEQGKPASLPKELAALEEKLYSENGFNGALSDKISLNRSLPDIRHRKCINRTYIESLPTVSVVVPFHNEHWSTLLRTVYSVLKRSPPELIKEIFLVDDASTKDFLKQKLQDYVKENLPKVQLVRVQKRSGLITARLAGARKATGDVLLFLDSHTEANVNWLPPLLEPIALNYKTVVCPFIDVVAYDTFEYRAQDSGARGAFDWELFYKRLPVLPSDELNMPEPFRSPVMAGGLFAISRKFFWELGGYDPGLDIWGGEQYELSFKIWQCGGEMFDAPCSRVGHIYRKFGPFPNPGHGDFVGKNYRRVAEVWMDEYAQHLYARRPRYLTIDPGDLAPQKALRQTLQCKPFKWFMHQIAFDLTAKYPPVEPKPFAEGLIRPKSDPSKCLDVGSGDKLQLRPCSGRRRAEQELVLSWHKDIRSGSRIRRNRYSRSRARNLCWDLPEAAAGSSVLLGGCHLGGGNQLWRYLTETHEIRKGDSDNCLDYDRVTKDVYIQPCDSSDTQSWTVDKVYDDMMKKWDDVVERVTGPVDY